MKKMIIALMAIVMSVCVASAQNYMVVDSEKVFKSIEAYNDALEDIEKLATQYQDAVDKKFAEVENLYNTYISQRSSLSISAQQQYEQLILQKEAEATEYQESLFGTDGVLMNKRLELIQPIQERVFNTIESFSKQYGYDLVIDIAANHTILYYSQKVDFTARIIDALK